MVSFIYRSDIAFTEMPRIGVLQKTTNENSFNLTYSIGHRGSAKGNLRKGDEDDEDFDLDD